MFDKDPLLFRVFPFKAGCTMGTLGMCNLPIPLSTLIAQLASLSSLFIESMFSNQISRAAVEMEQSQ